VVLDAAVDRLPEIIERTWGYPEDRPYTVQLDLHIWPGVGEFRVRPPGREEHPAPWAAGQLAKDHVLGVCSTVDGPALCELGVATMVVRLSRPAFPTPDEAAVEVGLWGGDLVGGAFEVLVEVRLIRESEMWSVSTWRVLAIS
jgi:hypothetical protein